MTEEETHKDTTWRGADDEQHDTSTDQPTSLFPSVSRARSRQTRQRKRQTPGLVLALLLGLAGVAFTFILPPVAVVMFILAIIAAAVALFADFFLTISKKRQASRAT